MENIHIDFFKQYEHLSNDVKDKNQFLKVSNYLDNIIFKNEKFDVNYYISLNDLEAVRDGNFVKLLYALRTSNSSFEDCVNVFEFIFYFINENHYSLFSTSKKQYICNLFLSEKEVCEDFYNSQQYIKIPALTLHYQLENIYHETFNFINDYFIKIIPKKIKNDDFNQIFLPLNILFSITVNCDISKSMINNYLLLIKKYIDNVNLLNQKQKEIFTNNINFYNNLFFKSFFVNPSRDIYIVNSSIFCQENVKIPHLEMVINEEGFIFNPIYNIDNIIDFYQQSKKLSLIINNDCNFYNHQFYDYFYNFLLENIKNCLMVTDSSIKKYKDFFLNEEKKHIRNYINNNKNLLVDFYKPFISNNHLFNQDTFNYLLSNNNFVTLCKDKKITIGHDYSQTFFKSITKIKPDNNERLFSEQNYFSLKNNLSNTLNGDDFDFVFLNNYFYFSFNKDENFLYYYFNDEYYENKHDDFYLNSDISVFFDFFMKKDEKKLFTIFFDFIEFNFNNNIKKNTDFFTISNINFNFEMFENFLFTHFHRIIKNIGISSFNSMLEKIYKYCHNLNINDLIYRNKDNFQIHLNNITKFSSFILENNFQMDENIKFQFILNYGINVLKNNNYLTFNVLNLDNCYKDKESEIEVISKSIFQVYENIYKIFNNSYLKHKEAILSVLIFNNNLNINQLEKINIKEKLKKTDLNSNEMYDFLKMINITETPIITILELNYTFLSNLILNQVKFKDNFVFKMVLINSISKLNIDLQHFKEFCIKNLNENILNNNSYEINKWNNFNVILNDVLSYKKINNKKIKI